MRPARKAGGAAQRVRLEQLAVEHDQDGVTQIANPRRRMVLCRTGSTTKGARCWWRVRAADAAATIRDVSAIVRDIDREIAIGHAAPLGDLVAKAVAGCRYQAMLFIAFGIIAIMIATTGVYASTTYGVSRRRREMNIRVALGASLSGVLAASVATRQSLRIDPVEALREE